MRKSPGQHRYMLVWVIVALMVIAGLGFVAFVTLTIPSTQSAPVEPVLDPLLQSMPTPQATPTPQDVVVYISGAVAQPDVYTLPHDARVKDVVIAAGGLLADADSEQINLAARIHDEQHIHVPRLGEVPANPPASIPHAPGGSTAPQTRSLVNLNSASKAELEELPGVGQVMAQRIVEYRQSNGPFESVEELQQVTGIGPLVFDQIKPLVTVGE